MPIQLNGNYFLVEEVATECGVSYQSLLRHMKRLGMKPLMVGTAKILTEEEKDNLHKYLREGAAVKADSLSLKEAAAALGISVFSLRKGVKKGIPVVAFHGRQCRIPGSVVDQIAESPFLEGTEANWDLIVPTLL